MRTRKSSVFGLFSRSATFTNIQTQEDFEKIVINVLPCVVASNLFLRRLKVLNFQFSPEEHLFLVEIFQVFLQLCNFIYDFSSFGVKSNATALNNQQLTTETSLNNFK